ncbi:hypothetical protein [Sinisalibacter lacisalsi]|uniref:hypothetical protein n=1 Tax=Sinisalibacter lacisalsi TaxID=1526570 RepID=UPI00166433AB|nr:hypothetical protein [Sinisalibacter lacisalsi]
MTVYIVGGSNSLHKEGWISRFRDLEPNFINLSVGATTSITGLFRAITTDDLGASDVIVWEYALNEINHIHRGLQANTLLCHIEHFARWARARNVAFAPAIFTPRRLEQDTKRAPYYLRLQELFDHYGLEAFDMSAEYRAALGVHTLPKNVFRDGAHYAHSREVLDFISQGVFRAVTAARVPAPVEPKITNGQDLQLITGFAEEVFSNSAMRVPYSRPSIRVMLPERSTVTAITFLSSPREDAFELIVPHYSGSARMPVSATHKNKAFPALLKTVIVPQEGISSMTPSPGKPVRIENWSGDGRLYAAHGCKRKQSESRAQSQARIAGIFVIKRARWARIARARKAVLRRLPQLNLRST